MTALCYPGGRPRIPRIRPAGNAALLLGIPDIEGAGPFPGFGYLTGLGPPLAGMPRLTTPRPA